MTFCDAHGWNALGNTQLPLLGYSPCSAYAILLSIPLVFLLLAIIVRWILGSPQASVGTNRIHRGWLYTTKMLVAVLTIAAYLVNIVRLYDTPDSVYHSLFMWFVFATQCQIIVVALVHKEHLRRKDPSSGVLIVYWLLCILALGVTLQAMVRYGDRADALTQFLQVSIGVTLGFYLVSIVLEHVPKSSSNGHALDPSFHPCPEERATFLSKITFSWINGLMKLGYKKPLSEEDLWDINHEDRAQVLAEKFQSCWKEEQRQYRKRPSLVRTLRKTVGGPFLFAAVFKLSNDFLQITQPQLLKLLIGFIQNQNEASASPEQKESPVTGFAIALVMLLFAITQSIVLHQYFHRCLTTGMRLRAALVTAIYKKALRLSSTSRQKSTVGEIVNHMSVDAQRLMDLLGYLHILWSGPLQISLSLFFLYREMGPSIFAGLGVMLLMIPVNAKLAIAQRKLQKMQMVNKDKRMKLMDEILSGIKVIKLYAWEKAFKETVETVRGREIANLKSIGFLSAWQTLTWSCTPFMVSFASFALYSAIGDAPLNPQKIFVSLALFNLLQFPLNVFPGVISSVVEASVALKRIYNFLLAEELDPEAVRYHPAGTARREEIGKHLAIEMQQASFRWASPEVAVSEESATEEPSEKDPLLAPVVPETILDRVTLQLKRKSLLAVIGKVGCGKSSLISAILGEMYRVPTEESDSVVHVYGRIAYVGQQAWIMNATVRDNILFGRPYDPQLYQKTVEACALVADIEMLPAGDFTQIGERGISLSGGQKQRLSLARAVYAQADIYLLDDPLSAVDAHVGRHIFDKVIGRKGMLADRSRLFVTHAIQYLSECDEVLMMRDGRVAEGPLPYGEFMQRQGDGDIWKLMNEFLLESNECSLSEGGDQNRSASPVLSERSSADARASSVASGSGSEAAKSPLSATKLSNAADEKRKEEGRMIVKEESAKGAVEWSVYLTYAKSCSLMAALFAMGTLILGQAANAGSNVWLEHWGSMPPDDRANTLVYLAVYGAFGLCYALLVVSTVIIVWVFCAIRSSRTLHQDLLASILRNPMSFFDTTPLGRMINRFSKDIYTIDEVLPRSFLGYFRTLFSVMTVFVMIIVSTPLFIVFLFPIGTIYFFVQRYYLSSSRELKRLDSVSRSPMYAHFSETLGGVSTIRAYNDVARFEEENEMRLNTNQKAYYPSIASNRWLAMRLEFLGSLVIFGAALFAVVGVVYFHNVSAGMAGLSVSYALMVTNTLNWMVRMSCEIETNIVSVERVKEYIDLPKEAPEVVPERSPAPTWPERGVIEFQNYSTRYRPGLDLVLHGVSFTIREREKIGIVGRTGAGKSSMMLSLSRLIEPVDGTIRIDGVDISQMGLYDLRSRLTIIPQDPVLFGGTVRFNLDPFQQYTDAEVWKALENAHLKEKIASMENQLNTEIMQGGENLSVGQRQLICLARALLRRSKILVLDEATAAVDVETDALLQATIRKEFADCTVLTIAHRIHTVMDSSRILVLEKGQVAELDTPSALLADPSSIFYGLAKEANKNSHSK